jgi:hypothetical protein
MGEDYGKAQNKENAAIFEDKKDMFFTSSEDEDLLSCFGEPDAAGALEASLHSSITEIENQLY